MIVHLTTKHVWERSIVQHGGGQSMTKRSCMVRSMSSSRLVRRTRTVVVSRAFGVTVCSENSARFNPWNGTGGGPLRNWPEHRSLSVTPQTGTNNLTFWELM